MVEGCDGGQGPGGIEEEKEEEKGKLKTLLTIA